MCEAFELTPEVEDVLNVFDVEVNVDVTATFEMPLIVMIVVVAVPAVETLLNTFCTPTH